MFDSLAWREYLRGTAKGEKVRGYVERGNVATPVLVVAELSAKFHRDGLPDWTTTRDFILAHSALVTLDWPVADRAGETLKDLGSKRRDAGLADAIVLETARALGAPLLTGDEDLRGAQGVMFLE